MNQGAPSLGEEFVAIGGEGASCFAVWHQPVEARFPPVVFSPPFFEEKRYAHRLFVEAARECARRGFPALRYDPRGTGDSDGEFTVAAAQADLVAAVRYAEARACAPAILLGLRLGATLAAKAAETRPAVLWAPVVSGDTYLRQTRRRQVIRAMLHRRDTDADREDIWDVEGYAVGAALREQIARLDLPADGPRGQTLIVDVGATGRVGADLGRLVARWPRAETVALIVEPFWSRLGIVDSSALINPTLDWLEGHGTADRI